MLNSLKFELDVFDTFAMVEVRMDLRSAVMPHFCLTVMWPCDLDFWPVDLKTDPWFTSDVCIDNPACLLKL